MNSDVSETKTLVSNGINNNNNNNMKTTTNPIIIASEANDKNLSRSQIKQNKRIERGKATRQIIASFIANMSTINIGFVFGFSAVVLPQLTGDNSTIHIDENQASWVASLSSAATPLGCILGGILMDRIGRKTTILATEIPLIVGWITIAAAQTVGMIYVGRLLVGLGSGMVGAPSRVYTSEITQPHLRGSLSALASVGLSLGVLIQYVIGSFAAWYVLAAISATIPLLAFILMCFIPESPIFLLTHDHPEQATKCLKRLRGSTYNVDEEYQRLQAFVTKLNTNPEHKSEFRDKMAVLCSPSTLKPFAILVMYFMMYQFSGVNTITFYAVKIFQDVGTTMDEYTCTIVLGIVRLIFTIVSAISLRRVGRRPLTFISGIGCGASMIGLGLYMYYKYQCDTAVPEPMQPLATWFPVLCIYTYTIACTLGFLVVPWIMIGELYPQKVRGIVGGATTCCAHIFVFFVVKTYPLLVHLLNHYGVFIVYGIISFLGTIFLYYCLPETKGKTLQEIEQYFSKKQTKSTQLTKNNEMC